MEDSHSFINYLIQKRETDRGALAALRRGLGKEPGEAPEMLRYIAPFVPIDAYHWQEKTYYIIASLFALHPENTGVGDMGAHLSRLKTGEDDALERRFTALLAAHPDELDVYLRQAISLLKRDDVPVNWNQLFKDVNSWGYPDGQIRVRRNWAKSFWARTKTEADSDATVESE